jgi:hypothetical protein
VKLLDQKKCIVCAGDVAHKKREEEGERNVASCVVSHVYDPSILEMEAGVS